MTSDGKAMTRSFQSARRHLEHEAEGAASGALVGGVVGASAGPPGAIAGAIVGGVAGALAAVALDLESSASEQRTRELDESIGVSGGDLGAPRAGEELDASNARALPHTPSRHCRPVMAGATRSEDAGVMDARGAPTPAHRDEGVIKYGCLFRASAAPAWSEVDRLDAWRSRCFDLGLVGVYADGVGYGNLSRRIAGTSTFWITGSATGAIPRLGPEHYARVVRSSPERNELECQGPVRASSESMTHAAIYEALPDVGAVIHVHSRRLWDALEFRAPTISAEVRYGTPSMCAAVTAMLLSPAVAKGGVLVMAGHIEGLVVFGRTVDEAGERLLALVG
jgi:hypothetical protein